MKKMTMKIVLTSILLMFGIGAKGASLCSEISLQDGRPWPWGSEVGVPWRNISGVWEVTDGSCENLFLFKVKTDQNGEKIVAITQYDPRSCKVIAQGLGYEADKYVYAQMARHGKSYNLTIHAFNQSSLSDPSRIVKRSLVSADPNKVVLALTLSPVGEWDNKAAFEITKVGSSEVMVCN